MKSVKNREYGPLPEWESLFLFNLCTKDDDYITLDYENSRQGIPPMKPHSDTLWSEEEQYTYFSIFAETVLLLPLLRITVTEKKLRRCERNAQ